MPMLTSHGGQHPEGRVSHPFMHCRVAAFCDAIKQRNGKWGPNGTAIPLAMLARNARSREISVVSRLYRQGTHPFRQDSVSQRDLPRDINHSPSQTAETVQCVAVRFPTSLPIRRTPAAIDSVTQQNLQGLQNAQSNNESTRLWL